MNVTLIFWSSVLPPMRYFISEWDKKTPLGVLFQTLCVVEVIYRRPSSQDIASQKFSMPSPVRTVIAADFDNDNELEVFFNNIAYRGPSANRLFRCSLPHTHSAYSMYIVWWKPHKQCLYLIFWNGPQQPSGVGKCGPGMLISSGIPPPPAHMSESLIKMGSGLSSWLSRWVSPPDNINELGFQAALYDVYQLLRLNNRMNASCLNEDLIWHTYTRIIPDAWGHEPLGQFKLTITDQHQASERFPVYNAGHCWAICLSGHAVGPTRSLGHGYCFCVSMIQPLLYYNQFTPLTLTRMPRGLLKENNNNNY